MDNLINGNFVEYLSFLMTQKASNVKNHKKIYE